MKQPCVYILASKRNGTLYVGVTSDIVRRAWEHRTGQIDGFTKHYGVHRLVFAEFHETMTGRHRPRKAHEEVAPTWKLQLIERDNRDLARFVRRVCSVVWAPAFAGVTGKSGATGPNG